MHSSDTRVENWSPVGRLALAALLIGLCVAGRLVDHPPNFTPLAAAAMVGGYLLGRGWLVFAVPAAAMFLSDLVIGGYEPGIMAVVYLSMLVPAALARFIPGRLVPLRILGIATLSSVTFFLTSNFAVWKFAGYYEPTWAGLVHCYTAAVPFFRYMWMGDVFWSAALFGCVWLAYAAPHRIPLRAFRSLAKRGQI
jgi:hypothetical protein